MWPIFQTKLPKKLWFQLHPTMIKQKWYCDPRYHCRSCGRKQVIARGQCLNCLQTNMTSSLITGMQDHNSNQLLRCSIKSCEQQKMWQTVFGLWYAHWWQRLQQGWVDWPDRLLCVSNHPLRSLRQNFSPSLYWTKYLSQQLGIPWAQAWHRRWWVPALKSGNQSQRRQRIRHGFIIHKKIALVEKIAIVDDISTTQTTFKILSEMLLNHHPYHIQWWCALLINK